MRLEFIINIVSNIFGESFLQVDLSRESINNPGKLAESQNGFVRNVANTCIA